MSCSTAATELLAAVAKLLITNGQTTEGARLAIDRLSRALGYPAQLQARWGEFALYRDGSRGVTWHEADPIGVDIGRVTATENVVDAVCAGYLSVDAAQLQLEAVEHRPPVSLARFAIMAAAGAAALAVIFGAPDVLTVVLVAIIAGTGACLRRAVSRFSFNPLLQPFVAAFLAGLAGGLVARWDLPVTHRLVMACPCMVLVPGPHFLNGAIDLVRVRLALGFARLALAGLIVLTICAGLLAGLTLVGANFPPDGATVPVPLALDVASAGVAVAAYASFFDVPWRLVSVPIGTGMIAHALRWELLQQGASLPLGAFVATLTVGVVITPVSHRFRLPFGASAFASVVSLIPGVYMFQAASDLVTVALSGPQAGLAPLLGAVAAGATAGLILLAMTTGLIIPKLCFDALLSRGRVDDKADVLKRDTRHAADQ